MNNTINPKKSFWQLSRKIPLLIAAMATLSALVIVFLAQLEFKAVQKKNIEQNFQQLTEQRREQLKTYLEGIESDLRVVAASPMTKNALRSFSQAWNLHNENPTQDLKRLYIKENPYPIGEKDKMDHPTGDGSLYSQVHKEYHPWFRTFLRERGYYDIFLVDLDGNLVYSVFKEEDFATNLRNGEWKDTDLGKTFRETVNLQAGEQVFYDFKSYKPSADAPASFIGQPIVVDGITRGALIFQMPIDRINQVVGNRSGLGESGEAVLVGADGLARNQSPLTDEPTILKRKVAGTYVSEALAGRAGVMTLDLASIGKNKAEKQIVGYAPFSFKNAKFALVMIQNTHEVMGIIDEIRNTLLRTLVIVVIVVIFIGIAIGRGIAGPIRQLTDLIGDLAAGRNRQIVMQERGDELGEMARSLQHIYRLNVENARIRAGLDNTTTCIMLADAERNIVYMNPAIQEMLRFAEDDIKKALPDFDADNVVGQSIDIYHKDPSHQAAILERLHDVHKARIELGGRTFNLTAAPVIGENGNRLGSVVEWADITESLRREEKKKKIAIENYRIRTALDNATTCVMVADSDRNIVYMNAAAQQMFKTAEADIRQSLPEFDCNNVLGQSIDVYHKNPAHQADMLSKMEQSYTTRMCMGSRTFTLTAAPVLDADRNRLGSVVEWKDISHELLVQEEVDNVVRAVVEGDFTKSISLDDKEGFMASLAQSINALKFTMSDVFEELAESLSCLAKGDLEFTITKDYAGTYETLKQDANQASARIKGIVTDIIVASNEITNAAKEISSGSIDLSQRTETQASSLEETAASMEEMATTVKQNAENAQQANLLAIRARDAAEEGGNVVKKAVEAMSSIEESSQKVSDIIGVIDEIAFQTNLLALNAAVEAARAGDAGKGFAVVASEVRTLAQRSSDAAKDIKGLITDSNHQVRDGVTLVDETGGSLANIVESIKRVADIVSEIAAASQQQAAGVGEINAAVTQMDEMTQQNAALVEESSASARALEEQSEKMMHMMSFFHLGEESTPGLHLQPAQQAGREAPSSISSATSSFKNNVKQQELKVENDGFDADWEEF